MKRKKPLPEPPDPDIERELARRLALYHAHAAARIMSDSIPYQECTHHHLISSIIRDLNASEYALLELA